ncbi:acyltransferase family protein [Epilithonimonas lactis]|uniref:acyltransferase family protein n=1 Tax=Epilithonimonas lactis TaxID=421072 RepID=UPI0005537108|nr:acyltransferase family protein [Epilithonimonas lactis]SEQ06076.1 Acyltransferase family protein [Epilithonimonas lactis]
MPITLQKSNQLKSIAILMMLFLHLFNRDFTGVFRPMLFVGKQPISYYLSLFCDACVPIFAFVSGYGLYFKYIQNKKEYQDDNYKRLKKLYINYWIILIVFAVLLGLILNKDGYPGSISKFFLNFIAINPSYNGAWWFFTTYVLFVMTSSFWFRIFERSNPIFLFMFLFLGYLIAFYFRIYKTDVFTNAVLSWFHRQTALYFCTLFQFMMGAFALKYQWNKVIKEIFNLVKFKNVLALILIVGLIVFHGLVPNFVVAPFTGLAFIFLFLQIKLPDFVTRFLDYFAPHATNIWLVHMFFYMIFFPGIVYGFKYVPVIFLALVMMCLASSYVINFIKEKIQRII